MADGALIGLRGYERVFPGAFVRKAHAPVGAAGDRIMVYAACCEMRLRDGGRIWSCSFLYSLGYDRNRGICKMDVINR
jgi:hypothetical protein